VLPERIHFPFQIDTQSAPDKILIAVELKNGVLEVEAPIKRLFSSTIYVFILWMVGTSIVLSAIAIYFLSRQIQPIRRLAFAAESFGKGVQVLDFKPTGAREVRQAANAFIRMRERIQRQISQRTEMLAGVSHDLRTPLTRMKLQLAMVPDSEAVDNLKLDISEMERMVEGFLAFARGEGSEVPVPTALDQLIAGVVDGARRRGATVEAEPVPEVTLNLRANAITRALTNLLDNAVRFGSHARVTVTSRPWAVEITIDDDGPGVEPDKREAVFKPFYRGDSARNPQTGGVGLGLTIARDVVRNHGGDVVLSTSPLGGLRALVRLPV
jgi:two-component system osmolarity sensor histidine kinase EnvZ